MPNNTEPYPFLRARRQRIDGGGWAAVALLALILTGCAATPDTSTVPDRPSPVLQQIATRLPGQYVSVRDKDRAIQSMSIEKRSASDADGVAFSLVQSSADGADERRFGLSLRPGKLDNRLNGRYALLGPGGEVRRSCPMNFHVTQRGLVGETDPASCRFGEGAEAVGLLKEIAFDGRGIRIGDRLMDPESGEPRGQDQVIRFFPARDFSGWLGIRDGDEWRVARDFSLRPGVAIEPLDAADMSLGFSIELNYYRMERGNEETLLRLTITDSESGETVAESWTEPGSRNIGVALPDLQVGLNVDGQ
ncbi:hypothetical protein [Wenzhouxiangella sp. EGI_FJ10305]|uniref:hypothetical protein n=1 Tax=Wenzhouxiangella sp. EGI_FJ10305 TaxID=3243768 RepID=UPI0035D843ED